MKLHIAALPVLASSYSMGTGGFRYYGRPDLFVSPGRVQKDGSSSGPSGSWQAAQLQQKEWVDRAFEQLESEFNGNRDRRRRAQEGRGDVVDRAFEQLETEFKGNPNRRRRAQDSRGDVVDRAFEQLETEFFDKEWVDRAFEQLESEFNGKFNSKFNGEFNSNQNRRRSAQEGRGDVVDRAFEQLETEPFDNNGTRNRRRRAQRHEDVVDKDNEEDKTRQQPQQEYLQKQQEWVNRAFGLATEAASEVASSSSGRNVKETKNEAVRRQQEWLNRAFGLATEVASDSASSSSPPRDIKKEAQNDAHQHKEEGVKEAKNEAVRQQQEWLNRAFGLATEVASDIASASSSSSPPRDIKREAKNEGHHHKDNVVNRDDDADAALRQQQQEQQEYLRKQQEWMNRAFGLATGVASPGRDVKEAKNEAVRQQQEWLNQAFGLATDVASGLSSPRYEVNDGNDAFQVALDVPGVIASDIEIIFNEDDSVLQVSGKRDIVEGGVARTVKFSKSFSLDSSVVDKDKISAQINNGVLLVTAPKVPIKIKEKKVRKIPVMQVRTENVPVHGPAGSAASDKPSPESKSSQTEEPKDGKKKDIEKPSDASKLE